ncbi:MAG: hypothetical protein JWN44_3833 [Myxococcales bacterium]|nr:hypothetical protein [Myxococcales bacterium]
MATTSNVNPRRTGFDFAALAASAGRQDGGEEVARLRTALETLAELVIAHGVMDARTLESIVGDLIRAPMVTAAPVPRSAPLPPPARSAAEAAAQGVAPRSALPTARPLPAAPKPIATAKPVAAPLVAAPVVEPARSVAAPVAVTPVVVAPKPVAAPVVAAPKPVVAPVVAAPQPVVAAPQPVVAAPQPVIAAPQPIVAAKPAEQDIASEAMLVSAPVVAPVVAEPFPAAEPFRAVAEPFAAATPAQDVDTRRTPKIDVARLAAELTELPLPSQKATGLLSRLFGKKKASPAAVAASAASVEFTERMPKLPFDLYGDQQKATELSFPPVAPPRTKSAATALPRKRSATPVRPANAGPTRFCDRCWRKLDGGGACKGCAATA